MKKGFTLVELIAVIVLLAALALLSVPIVNKTIEHSKEKVYNGQIDAVIKASKRYVTEIGPKSDDLFTITFQELMDNKLIEKGSKIQKTDNVDISSKIEVEVSYDEISKSYIYNCYIKEADDSKTEC